MSALLLVAAIVFAAIDVWWVALPMLFAGIVFARLEALDRRDARRMVRRQMTQLRRRQLDRICDRNTVENRGRRYGA